MSAQTCAKCDRPRGPEIGPFPPYHAVCYAMSPAPDAERRPWPGCNPEDLAACEAFAAGRAFERRGGAAIERCPHCGRPKIAGGNSLDVCLAEIGSDMAIGECRGFAAAVRCAIVKRAQELADAACEAWGHEIRTVDDGKIYRMPNGEAIRGRRACVRCGKTPEGVAP
jgi:hypothetical protein